METAMDNGLRLLQPSWLELRRYGRLWARYNPKTRELELARGEQRVVFALALYDLPEAKAEPYLHGQKIVLE